MATETSRPRLCYLRKVPDYEGYGFNLNAKKGKSGQYVGKVEPGSPADVAGLRDGDRVVEVNGENVSNENFSQVVQRIKAVENEVTFLVVDADAYHRDRNVETENRLENVEGINNNADSADTSRDKTGDNKQNDAEQVECGSYAITSNVDADNDAVFHARLCELKTWSDFDGYGFELHADDKNDVKYMYITKIEAGSPAEAVGLQEGDRVIEVNGVNVVHEFHQEVFSRIKAINDHVSLLVVDSAAEQHFRQCDVRIDGQMTQVLRVTCPDVNPASAAVAVAIATASEQAVSGSYAATTNVDADNDAVFHARLCELKTWSDFDGYGFELHADDDNDVKYIGRIEPGSPAEAVGLKEGERIVEVNGVNVIHESHQEVFSRIKAMNDHVSLLVIDYATEQHFRQRDVIIDGQMTQVLRVTCPDVNPAAAATAAAVSVATDSVVACDTATHPHRVRLCHLHSWDDGHGYGFNMQAHPVRPGQFVWGVDAGSPAEAAGLVDGDRIIEVNGDNVERATHSEVVEKIKSISGEVKLLVVDPDADEFFTNNKIVIVESMDCVDKITCPETKPAALIAVAAENSTDQKHDESSNVTPATGYVKVVDTKAAKSAKKRDKATADDKAKQLPVEVMVIDVIVKKETEQNDGAVTTSTPADSSVDDRVETTETDHTVTTSTQADTSNVDKVELAATADEARKRISKKKDVKSTSMSMKAKYEIFQKM